MIKTANYGSNITLNSVVLRVTDLVPIKTQKTRKSLIGKTIVETPIIGLNAQQWQLDVSGIVVGTTTANLSTNRAAIEALDTGAAYAYVDGIHDGNYRIKTGSLSFSDSQDQAGMHYKYTMVIIED